MSSFLHGLGLLLLPLCGWLAGDAVQAQTTLHLAALQGTITLLQRIRQEIQYRRADLQSLYRQLCREGLLPQKSRRYIAAVACTVAAFSRGACLLCRVL